MPHYPAAWSHEAWKPIGGCSFTGGPCALTGNSAFRCCLLLQWHAIVVPPTVLFPNAGKEDDSDVETAGTVSETDQNFLERSLLAAAADQNSRESGSSPPETWQADGLPRQKDDRSPATPQLATPALFCVMARNCAATRHSGRA